HRAVERIADRLEVMSSEIGHERVQVCVVVLVENLADAARGAEVAHEVLAELRAAAIDERRVERVRAALDPVAQRIAAAPCEDVLETASVFQGDYAPAHGFEDRVDALEQ